MTQRREKRVERRGRRARAHPSSRALSAQPPFNFASLGRGAPDTELTIQTGQSVSIKQNFSPSKSSTTLLPLPPSLSSFPSNRDHRRNQPLSFPSPLPWPPALTPPNPSAPLKTTTTTPLPLETIVNPVLPGTTNLPIALRHPSSIPPLPSRTTHPQQETPDTQTINPDTIDTRVSRVEDRVLWLLLDRLVGAGGGRVLRRRVRGGRSR